MNKIILCMIIFSVSVYAQITITESDFASMFTVGNQITIKQNETGGSIDIGTSGGGNTWDFSGLQGNLQMDMLSIDPATSPYFDDFPDANIATYSVGDYQGDQAELWNYTNLNSIFGNLGAATILSSQPEDLITIKNNPPRNEAQLPLTINSSWSQTFTQTLYINGVIYFSSQISYSVVVDAYGTMTIPGGAQFEALRLRETSTINGITDVTYQFLSKTGAQVSVYATDPNPSNSGVIAVDGFEWNSEFSGSGFVITVPDSDYVMIAGEVDSIKYGEWNGEVNLYYKTDYNMEYTLIDSNYSSGDGVYYWDVPDSILTTRARIKVVDVLDTNIVGISDFFKIKPWQLSRIDADENFVLFKPNADGWPFCNCQSNIWPMSWWQQFNYSGIDTITGNPYPNQAPFDSAQSSDFLDWLAFVDVFGVEACYMDNPPSTYSSVATTKWAATKGNWKGSCAGFATSSLLGFYFKSGLIYHIGYFDSLYDINVNDSARHVINIFQNYQFGKENQAFTKANFSNTPRQLLSDLKTMLKKNNFDGRTLSFYNNNGSGGHRVIPYKLERIGNTSTFNILLYNSNAPGSLSQKIYLDSTANTWSDSTALNWGTGSSGCFLQRRNMDYLSMPTLNKSISIPGTPLENTGLSRLEIYNTSNADMIITSGGGGQIGYQDSLVFNDITDAIPIIPETGNIQPPIGYDLPGDIYSLQLNNFLGPASYVFFFSDSTIYNYRRFDADGSQTDLLSYSQEGVKIFNPDPMIKNISLETIIVQGTSLEKVFVLDNLSSSSGDSIHIRENGRNELVFQNSGENMNYDLQIRIASAGGGTLFSHKSIPMGQNSGHKVVPVWNDLQNTPVMILIDLGNDGTIDDTLFVTNQATNIENRNYVGIPGQFKLLQNYPNPFNPTTTITYDLPSKSDVNLSVYNILGEKVATLVNEVKQAGRHDVVFNGSGLASGIYFYKIQAGNFVQTKKMLLIK